MSNSETREEISDSIKYPLQVEESEFVDSFKADINENRDDGECSVSLDFPCVPRDITPNTPSTPNSEKTPNAERSPGDLEVWAAMQECYDEMGMNGRDVLGEERAGIDGLFDDETQEDSNIHRSDDETEDEIDRSADADSSTRDRMRSAALMSEITNSVRVLSFHNTLTEYVGQEEGKEASKDMDITYAK